MGGLALAYSRGFRGGSEAAQLHWELLRVRFALDTAGVVAAVHAAGPVPFAMANALSSGSRRHPVANRLLRADIQGGEL